MSLLISYLIFPTPHPLGFCFSTSWLYFSFVNKFICIPFFRFAILSVVSPSCSKVQRSVYHDA